LEKNDENLAGDELEEILKRMGADKLAAAYEEVSGKDCGCDKRKQWLNNLHRKFKEWLNRIRS